jgi:hypothetical protein
VKHEVNDSALIQPAQIAGGHLQKSHILRQKLSGRGLKERERPGQHQREARENEQWTPIAGNGLNQAAIIAGVSRHLGKYNPTRPLPTNSSVIESVEISMC